MFTDDDCITSFDKLFHVLITLTEKKYFLISLWQPGLRIFSIVNPLVRLSVSRWKKWLLHNLKTSIRAARFLRSSVSNLCWTVFARNRDTAVPAEGNGDLQTLGVYEVLSAKKWSLLSSGVHAGPQIQETRDDRNIPQCPTVCTHRAVNFHRKLQFFTIWELMWGHMAPCGKPVLYPQTHTTYAAPSMSHQIDGHSKNVLI